MTYLETKYQILFFILFSAINIKSQTTSMWSGSGIVLSTDGYIATNNHVVESGLEFFVDVFTNGVKKTYKANVIKTDAENDLAIIKIVDTAFKNFNTIPYSLKMQGINVGEKVFAMGYPEPDRQGEEVKVTDGIISSKTGRDNNNKTYQISAPIQHGSSGGPLFDDLGNLIGITNAGLQDLDNVGYAIKISYLNNFLDLIPNFPAMPLKTAIAEIPFTEKIKVLSNFTVLIWVSKPNCDLKTPSELFNKITSSYSYDDVSKLFNQPGENYNSNGSGAASFEWFKWYFCENKYKYVECRFLNNKLVTAMKMFKNDTCNSFVTEDNYNMIKLGLSYNNVCNILHGEGDKYSNNFQINERWYRWFDCKNENFYYDVWFRNDKVITLRKGDVSQEQALFGK